MFTRRRQRIGGSRLAGILLALPLLAPSADAVGANSLATPITSELRQALWPVEIGVEIATVDDDTRDDAPIEVLPLRTVTVPDGHPVAFGSAIWTPQGRLHFEVDVAAHQHPRDEIEVEWDLRIEGAPYETVSVGEYLLHRLRFGPRPDVGPQQVRASRADIVTVRDQAHVETVEIDGEKYEIRIFALSVRG